MTEKGPIMKQSTEQLIAKIVTVAEQEPIEKMWLFGSFSRGEERPDSDVDILVQMSPNDLSMLGFLKIQTRLEKATHKVVDLIEDECLEDFARPSAERDKILIYAR